MVSVGSTDFACRQVGVFNADLSRSRLGSLHEWQQRPLARKSLGHAASLIGAVVDNAPSE